MSQANKDLVLLKAGSRIGYLRAEATGRFIQKVEGYQEDVMTRVLNLRDKITVLLKMGIASPKISNEPEVKGLFRKIFAELEDIDIFLENNFIVNATEAESRCQEMLTRIAVIISPTLDVGTDVSEKDVQTAGVVESSRPQAL